MSKSSLPAIGKHSRFYRVLTTALICMGSGVVTAFAFPPYDISGLVWVGMLPLLCVLWTGRAGFWRGFVKGWLYGMGMYGMSFHWISEVGKVFFIPYLVFLGVAILPLFSLLACLPGLWAGMAASLLRPRLTPGPTVTAEPQDRRREAWGAWARTDLLSALRSAVGLGALWVCIEWLRGYGPMGFSWNSLGMALYDGLSFAQWAEFVGTNALSFIPVATSVVLWCSMRRVWMTFRGSGKACRPWDFYATVVLLFALFTGGLMLSKAYSPALMMKRPSVLQLPVAAVQINLDQRERMECGRSPALTRAYLNATMQAFRDVQQETVQQARHHPEVGIIQQLPVWVIWPESAMGTPFWKDFDTQQQLPDADTMALLEQDDTGLTLLRRNVREMGGQNFVLFTGVDELLLDRREERLRGMYNSLAVIPGGFGSVITASKQHLMPFGEYIPLTENIEWIGKVYTELTGTQVGDGIRPGVGNSPLIVPVPGTDETVQVIPAICYEDTVASQLRRFVRKGAQVIVNNTNDAWFGLSACGVQQARAAAFRCIELRRPMVRAANRGVCCTIAPNGAVISALLKGDGTPHLAGSCYGVLPVDREAGLTLYAILGDWAVALSALLAMVLSLPAFPLFRKKS